MVRLPDSRRVMSSSSRSRGRGSVEIRRLRPEEWSAHRELRLKALATDPLAFGSTLVREEAFADELWKARTVRGAASNDTALFVADAGSEGLVGMVAIALLEGQWHVFAMWVEPGRRGEGIGGMLLDAGLNWFRARTSGEPLHLDVNPRQGDAVRLYENRGFRRTGISSPLGHTDGETTVSMVLDVPRASRKP